MSNNNFHKLEETERGVFNICSKKKFEPLPSIEQENIEKCFSFAYKMSFTGDGYHRSYRSGGTHNRRNGEIFINTFQGKFAEYCLFNLFRQKNISVKEPDMSVHGLGIWDSVDLIAGEKKINIKSTKHYGNLFLLETKDWDNHGRYVPNINSNEHTEYDYFILLRVKPDCEKIMKSEKLYYTDYIESDVLQKIICSHIYEFDVPGFISRDELVKVVKKGNILPKGSLLNKTKMDAENYYIQVGDMNDIAHLYTLLR